MSKAADIVAGLGGAGNISEIEGCTIDQLALAAALERPWIDCVLSGAATADQVRSNAGALHVALDDESRDALSLLAEPVGQYWETRARLPWN